MNQHARGQQILAELADLEKDLPFSPEMMRDLFNMTGEQSLASAETVAQAIARDQGLTTKILAMANSAFYGLQSKVTSVPRAVALLGLKELRNLVMVLSAQCLACTRPLPPSFDLKASWRHQLHVAVCARLLAQRIQGLDPDALFTAGMLHDLGKLLIAMIGPEDFEAVAAKVRDEGMPFARAEDELLGLDHGLVGAMALNAWNLPPALTEPVSWHHAPRHSPEHAKESSVVCIADALVHALEDPEFSAPCGHAEHLAKVGVDREEFLAELREALADDGLSQFLSHIA